MTSLVMSTCPQYIYQSWCSTLSYPDCTLCFSPLRQVNRRLQSLMLSLPLNIPFLCTHFRKMHRFLACLGLFLLHCTSAAPAPDSASTAPKPSVTALTRRQVYHCDANWMKAIEAQAWADAGALADEAFKWSPGARWQPAMDLYMGKNSVQNPYKGQVVGEFVVLIPSRLHNDTSISAKLGFETAETPIAPTLSFQNQSSLFTTAIVRRLMGVPPVICNHYRKGRLLQPFALAWVNHGAFYVCSALLHSGTFADQHIE